MRPFSGLSFSFQSLAPEQSPAVMTRLAGLRGGGPPVGAEGGDGEEADHKGNSTKHGSVLPVWCVR